MAVIDTVTDNASEMINARGRSPAHVLEGVALCLGAVVLSALITAKAAPANRSGKEKVQERLLEKPEDMPPKSALASMWPTLVLVLTLSGLRVWNAPPSPARARALGLWAAIQGLNALWMAWSPRQQTAQLATSALTLGVGLGYANEARKVDGTAAALVSPYLGWSSFVGLLAGQVWKKNKDRPTVR